MRLKDSIHRNIIFESEVDRLDPTRKIQSAPSNGTDHPILKVDFRRKIWNINNNQRFMFSTVRNKMLEKLVFSNKIKFPV